MKYDFTLSYFLRILVETTLEDKILVVCLAPFSLFLTVNVVLGLQQAGCLPSVAFFWFFLLFFLLLPFSISIFWPLMLCLGCKRLAVCPRQQFVNLYLFIFFIFLAFNGGGFQKVGCLPSVAVGRDKYLSFYLFYILCFYLSFWPLVLQKVGCLPSVAIRKDK